MNIIDWKNPDEVKEYMRKYKKEYRKIEKNKEKHRQEQKLYYEKNKDLIKERNKNRKKTYNKDYIKTQIGRAWNLISAYNQSDKKHNRGRGNLTAQWIVENIFSSKCKCGETDWHKLGCNRVNNDLPHTTDNVVCCCTECNKKLPRKK